LGQSDVIRHRLVKKIIEAFDKAEIEAKAQKELKEKQA
jgi:phosphate starvation-inducible protein PhoH